MAPTGGPDLDDSAQIDDGARLERAVRTDPVADRTVRVGRMGQVGSRTSRTLRPSASGLKGFWMKSMPSPSTPWRTMALSV